MAEAAATPRNSEQSSNSEQIPSKSDSNALCKTLIILILVLVIPLFPSQAPDFITQTVFTDFWEIIHLLFIGIAVSYGLFGRRTARTSPDKFVDSTTDDSRSYLSGISHLTSIFDDGYNNVCYEHDMMQSYMNCGDQFSGKDECVVRSGSKIRSLAPNDGNESVSGGNVDRAWCSRYSKGESLVVVSNAKCFLGESSDFKPLNLPVRSLRSRDMDSDRHEFKKGNEFSPKIEAKADVDVVKIRGVVPMNLDSKFEEVAGRSKIPWRSRSGRMENGEEISYSKLPLHSRPHSVGEFEFEHIKYRPLRDSKFSASPELEVENLERKRVFTASHSKVAPVDSEASSLFNSAKTRPFSTSASSDMDSVVNLENDLKNSGVDEEVRKGKQTVESLDSDEKSSSRSKVVSRAKSVRTIKPKRCITNQKEHCSSRGDGKFGRVFIKSEADSLIKSREEEPDNPTVDHQNQESGRLFSMPKPKPTIMSEFHNEEEQDIDDRNATESEDTDNEFDKSSDEDDTRTNIDNDGELGSEVDRKAGEFIAKFREQIRLQKTCSSLEGYSGCYTELSRATATNRLKARMTASMKLYECK
ncbi:hypothetical protein C2S52_010955 [Perilla frutescens var. hirtella]|nr:hypothetical protein C2S52_010955 [Perilla frutescens var. hirtella]KAH6817762.1 hypothetical protein C2S51_001365 [Perilla frutescens var. frutescens]